MNKMLIGGIVVAFVVVGAGSFYGGMQFAGAQPTANRDMRNARMGDFSGISTEQRQARGFGLGDRMGGGMVSGEIISKDDATVTLKLLDGGSKIILFSSSTVVTKNVAGSPDDLIVGEQVMVTGMANQDGSVSAQTLQMRNSEGGRQ